MKAKFVKTLGEIEKIAAAGAILKQALAVVASAIKPGITLKSLDVLAQNTIVEAGGEPAFLGYQPEGARRPYPATLCTSVNDVVVHGVPSDRKLKNGDVCSIDLGVRLSGYYADSAITVVIGGKATNEVQKLVKVTREALDKGIAAARAGNTLGDIGFAISEHARKNSLKVIRGLTGHGIGTNLHEDPSVFNEGEPGKGLRLLPGMTLALEPMFSIGSSRVEQLDDESYATSDGSIAAHFEHTIVITEKGARVLT